MLQVESLQKEGNAWAKDAQPFVKPAIFERSRLRQGIYSEARRRAPPGASRHVEERRKLDVTPKPEEARATCGSRGRGGFGALDCGAGGTLDARRESRKHEVTTP